MSDSNSAPPAPTNPGAWFEIYVNDLSRAKAFYQTVLNQTLEHLPTPDSSIEMEAFPADMNQYGAAGAIVKMPDFPAGGNSTIIYFASEDCAIEESRIEAAGGKVQQSKMAIGEYGFIVMAYDTEGNMFGLHSQQ